MVGPDTKRVTPPAQRDIDTEYRVWVRMFGQSEADRLRMNAEAAQLLDQLDDEGSDSKPKLGD